MCEENQTEVTEVLFLGFQSLKHFKIPLFILCLAIYIVILIGNHFIIIIVSLSHQLRRPMYLFLKNLALADVLFTSNVLPQLLYVILEEGGHISITGCKLQYYFHSFLAFAQSLLLTVMSFDRYLAICNPLHYAFLMNAKHSLHLANLSWIFSFILISSEMILIYQVKFCNMNIIDHFYCDIGPILQLSSSDTFILIWYDFVIALLVIFFPCLFVIASYVCIIMAILKINTTAGRQKAFSTCSSHLTIVCIYYGTLVAIYMVPSTENSVNENKFKSLLYTVLTPFLNPIIYSLRSKELLRNISDIKLEKCEPNGYEGQYNL
ncbi:olfactory receptor 1S1-like [Pelobates fuscus]|uniref:olfactory receptor 1S1-like n=1 Tax=Pelobates fuscus TaxID=191477 RepID=UPI002FE44899